MIFSLSSPTSLDPVSLVSTGALDRDGVGVGGPTESYFVRVMTLGYSGTQVTLEERCCLPTFMSMASNAEPEPGRPLGTNSVPP